MKGPKKDRHSSRLGAALALAAFGAVVLAAPLLAAGGYLVSDEKKECLQVAANPGIGVGGYYYSETCPEGYTINDLPQPEQPWWIKLLNQLDKLFGLSDKYLWVFSVSKLASIAAAVLLVKRILGVVGATIAGKWTWLVTAVVGFLSYIEPLLSDGKLSVYEAILAVFYVVFGSSVVWKTMKALIQQSPLLQELKGAVTGK